MYRYSQGIRFFMLLRKKILGGRVVEFSKEPAERILILEVEKRSLSNQLERFRLVIRLIPHTLNFYLLDALDGIIASAFPIADRGERGKIRYLPVSPVGKYRVGNITQSQFVGLFARALATQDGLDPSTVVRVLKQENHSPDTPPWTSIC